MRKILAAVFAVLAGPVLAHDGPHLHPHGVEAWPVGLALLVIAGAGAVAIRVRK